VLPALFFFTQERNSNKSGVEPTAASPLAERKGSAFPNSRSTSCGCAAGSIHPRNPAAQPRKDHGPRRKGTAFPLIDGQSPEEDGVSQKKIEKKLFRDSRKNAQKYRPDTITLLSCIRNKLVQ